MKLRDLGPEHFDRTVWHYMSFTKFVSMLTYKAVWFSKLNILQDQYEGLIPNTVKARICEKNQEFKKYYNTPEFHRQIDAWPAENEDGGRELLVVTCWFMNECESPRMWKEYGGSNEAVAVKSTIGRLAQCIRVVSDEHYSQLGMVSYINHATHNMSEYVAQQAIERAFLKERSRFSHEQEIRLVTVNWKTIACISPSGIPYTLDQVEGAKTNNFEHPGLYISANLDRLITEVVTCPTAQEWFTSLVRRLSDLGGLSAPVTPSLIQNA